MAARSNKPVVLSQSRVDLRDFGVIPAVVAGQPVVRRLPPTKGVDGINVRGEITLAPPGQPLEWKPGEGAEVSPSDPDLLLASRDGMPRVLEASAAVDEVYSVKKVDLSTGHIQFKGAVIVNG
ncbi:FapA family protein, partial [Escherichia coli]|uniref:FapA family protein n=1 Tax=Escherichia coli TaxID=562 RepID=UPI00128E9631